MIDLKSGYNLIGIKEGDQWKMAFRARYGYYKYWLMPFGLAKAPGMFQNIMNEMLRDLIVQGVMVYIVDILIYTHDMKELEILVKEVLSKLHASNLAASIDKYKFHMDTVEFLRDIISRDGIAMSEETIIAFRSWESLNIQEDIQPFTRFGKDYGRFIENFSTIV
jgi:hypothetical protein